MHLLLLVGDSLVSCKDAWNSRHDFHLLNPIFLTVLRNRLFAILTSV